MSEVIAKQEGTLYVASPGDHSVTYQAAPSLLSGANTDMTEGGLSCVSLSGSLQLSSQAQRVSPYHADPTSLAMNVGRTNGRRAKSLKPRTIQIDRSGYARNLTVMLYFM